MADKSKLIEAAELIAENCIGRECENCVFWNGISDPLGYSGMCLLGGGFPDGWMFKENLQEKAVAEMPPVKDAKKVINVKMHADVEPPAPITGGDWVDLRAAEDVEMDAGEYRVISLGVSMRLPDGYEAHMVARSSTFKRWGLLMVNGMAIIDNSYSGDGDVWGFPALATRKTSIRKGDRICQFRIMENQPEAAICVVDSLGGTDRGGFGSTGTR